MPTTANSEEVLSTLMTIQEVADLLRVSVRTLETIIEKGEIIPIRIGGGSIRRGVRRFTQESIRQYLEINRAKSIGTVNDRRSL